MKSGLETFVESPGGEGASSSTKSRPISPTDLLQKYRLNAERGGGAKERAMNLQGSVSTGQIGRPAIVGPENGVGNVPKDGSLGVGGPDLQLAPPRGDTVEDEKDLDNPRDQRLDQLMKGSDNDNVDDNVR